MSAGLVVAPIYAGAATAAIDGEVTQLKERVTEHLGRCGLGAKPGLRALRALGSCPGYSPCLPVACVRTLHAGRAFVSLLPKLPTWALEHPIWRSGQGSGPLCPNSRPLLDRGRLLPPRRRAGWESGLSHGRLAFRWCDLIFGLRS